MAENIDLVSTFASQLYPEVPVVINGDIRWSDLTLETGAVLSYYANIIDTHDSPTIAETISDLVKFGHGKGTNGSTRDTATKYSAVHNLVWGLDPNYIETQYLSRRVPADVVIRIGPHAEARFDAMIMAIRRQESKEGFIAYVRQNPGFGPAEKEQISASVYEHGITEPEATAVLLTSKIGRHGPTYFSYPWDKPIGYPLKETLREIQQRVCKLTSRIQGARGDIGTPLAKLVEERAALLARAYDIQAINNAMGARLALVA